MKKITTILTIALLLVTAALFAQPTTTDYTNEYHAIGQKMNLLPSTQFYAGGRICLVQDTADKFAYTKKDGSWKIYDLTIIIEEGRRGIFDKVEVIDGKTVVWVKFKVKFKTVSGGKVKNKKEIISIPFTTAGPGEHNAFAVTHVHHGTTGIAGDNRPANYFGSNGHIYQYTGTAAKLHISATSASMLAKGIDLKVKN